ncbi:MAG: nucleotidyltransferase domain-containing protein [Candidatus Bathyarchaeia archaeon]
MGGRHQTDPEFNYLELSCEEKNSIIELLRKRLKRDPGIVLAYVHGGFVSNGPFRDLDIALWIKEEGDAWCYTVDLSAQLEVEIGAPVDVQVLNKAPLLFRYRVLTQGNLLLSRDDGFRARIVDKITRQYLDLREANKLVAEG